MFFVTKLWLGNSPEVQWLGLHNFTTEGMGSVSGLRTKIPQAMRCDQKIKVVTNLLIEEKEVLSFYYLFSLYCTACGILVHQPGVKCEPLHWKHRILTSGLPGNLKKQVKKKLNWRIAILEAVCSLPTGPITRVAFEAQFPNTPNLDSNIISLLESYLLCEVCLGLCIY